MCTDLESFVFKTAFSGDLPLKLNVPTLALFACVSCATASAQNTTATTQPSIVDERASLSNRRAHIHQIPPEMGFHQTITDAVLTLAPLELGGRWDEHFEPSSVSFTVNKGGYFSDWQMTSLSDSVTRDFWTLWAVASCPPVKVPEEIKTPFSGHVFNYLGPSVRGADAEQARLQLGYSITRKANAKYVYFALIPSTLPIEGFGGFAGSTMSTHKDYLVGIDINRLWPASKGKWTPAAVNKRIAEDKQLSEFLCEWSKYYKARPDPTIEQVRDFAISLMSKYKTLLVHGSPEAPFP